MFSSSKNSVCCRQLFLWDEMTPVTAGGMVPEVPFVLAVLLGALSSTAMVLLSKKEKTVEKAGEARACREAAVVPVNREGSTALNSVAYRKVGTMGTESQEGQVVRAKDTLSFYH